MQKTNTKTSRQPSSCLAFFILFSSFMFEQMFIYRFFLCSTVLPSISNLTYAEILVKGKTGLLQAAKVKIIQGKFPVPFIQI